MGKIDLEAQRLLDVTKAALYKGIEQAKAGNRIGDIGYAVQSYCCLLYTSQTIHHEDRQREQETIFKLGNLPCVTECLEHLTSPQPFRRLLDFLFGRSGIGCGLPGQSLGQLAVAQNLNAVQSLLDQTLSLQSLGIDDIAGIESRCV